MSRRKELGLDHMGVQKQMRSIDYIGAFSDVIMGKIVDSTKSSNGKCAPWFARMAIPAFFILIGLFTVPSDLSDTGQFLYLLATNFIHTSIVATAVLIPYNSLLSNCFTNWPAHYFCFSPGSGSFLSPDSNIFNPLKICPFASSTNPRATA